MAIKAISVAGMGRIFMNEKEVDKVATVYEGVRPHRCLKKVTVTNALKN